MSKTTTVNELGQPVGCTMKDWSPPPLPPHVMMAGRYCRLEPLKVSLHAQELWNAQSKDTSGASWTYMPHGPYASFEDFEKWLESADQSKDPQYYAIIVDEHAVGFVVYVSIKPSHGTVEVGAYFSPVLAKSSAATEAMYLVASKAFKLGYRRFSWNCDSLNVESRNSATRFGFTYEREFRQPLVFKDHNCDTMWFSIIDQDWNGGLKEAYKQWLEVYNFDEAGQQKLKLSVLTAPFVHARS